MKHVRWYLVIPAAIVLATAIFSYAVLAMFTPEEYAQFGWFLIACSAVSYIALRVRDAERAQDNDK